MALNPSQQWWVRIAGNELNGGGFDDEIASPGVNRANQDAAHVTFNGTSVTATTAGVGATITITGHTVSADDVANTLRIASGTNYTAGYYTIVSVNVGANTWTLDRNCTSGAGSALVGRMEGAHAYITSYASGGVTPTLATPLIAGNIINMEGSAPFPSSTDYTPVGLQTWPDGDSTNGLIRLRGFDGRPGISGTDVLMWFGTSGWVFESIAFLGTTASGFPAAGFVNSPSTALSVSFVDCYYDSAGFDISWVTDGRHFINCLAVNTGSTSAGTRPTITLGGEGNLIQGCVVLDQRGDAIVQENGLGVITESIIARGSANGITNQSGTGHRSLQVIGCTIQGNAGDGIELSTIGAIISSQVRNCIITENGGWGINASAGSLPSNMRFNAIASDYNAFFDNASGAIDGLDPGANDVTLTGDPFTNAAADDFSLNNTAGAGAACRSAAQPGEFIGGTTTSLADIGAVMAAVVLAFRRFFLY